MSNPAKTEYKYIKFEKTGPRWVCRNKRSDIQLGYAEYYSEWHQWVFTPTTYYVTSHSASCLHDIANFLEQLNG